MAEKTESVEAAVSRWWVQCNKCLKWRRGTRGKDQAEKFICSDLLGISCRTGVEDSAKNGRPKEEDCASDEEEPVPLQNGSSSSEQKRSHKRQTRGWGKGKRANPTCPKCGEKTERYASGKERHYRMSPICRPIQETTPGVIAGLVLDLSDRLPYMAVMRKDMRMWENFTTRTKACTMFDQAAKELLWLFKQLKSIVFDPQWDEARAQSFRDECENCSTPEQALQLLQRMELEAIDWPKVFELWETERSEESALLPADPPARKRQRDRQRDRHGGKRKRAKTEAERKQEKGQDEGEEEHGDVKNESELTKEEEDHDVEEEGADDDADVDAGGAAEVEEEHEEEPKLAYEGEDEEKEEEVYTVGTLIEVQLDDDEQALAIISRTPEEGSDDKHQVTFLDDKQQIALDDTLLLELPNEFVKVLMPCEVVPGLPKGWIPVPAGEEERRFVGPQGQLCRTVEEIRKMAQFESM